MVHCFIRNDTISLQAYSEEVGHNKQMRHWNHPFGLLATTTATPINETRIHLESQHKQSSETDFHSGASFWKPSEWTFHSDAECNIISEWESHSEKHDPNYPNGNPIRKNTIRIRIDLNPFGCVFSEWVSEWGFRMGFWVSLENAV